MSKAKATTPTELATQKNGNAILNGSATENHNDVDLQGENEEEEESDDYDEDEEADYEVCLGCPFDLFGG